MFKSQFDLNQRLKEKGFKITWQRKIVLDTIEKNSAKHLTSQELHDIIKLDNPEVGVATVYRTLIMLEKLSIITRISFDDGSARYELRNNYKEHRHHHLICNNCGEIEEVQDDLLEELESNIKKSKGFKVIDHMLKFYGLCKKCSQTIDDIE